MNIIKQFVKQIISENKVVKLHFDILLPDELLEISKIFSRSGAKFYLVGGSIRDALLGKTPKDFDVATNLSPDDVISLMSPHKKFKILEVGKSFGVVVVVAPSGEEYEIATFRKDIGTGRRPDSVEFTTIENDVSRRDLTINSLFYDIETKQIIDFVGGIDDVKNKVVRTTGDPKIRFQEDRLRILRCLRFAIRFGSQIEPETAAAIMENNSLAGISPERIRDEFIKCVKSATNVHRVISVFNEFDMFSQVFPGLKISNRYYPTKNIPVFLSIILENNPKDKLAVKLNQLKYTQDEVSKVCFYQDFVSNVNDSIIKMKKAYKNCNFSDQDNLEFSKTLDENENKIWNSFLSFTFTVTSQELMEKGFFGKALGEEISRLEQLNWQLHLRK